MNVVFISQCSKRALPETRRILDQFAERRGDRTWQTAITMEGLNTLRKLLRKSARKNTAVICHWIRGKDHSEVLWMVGDISRFNPQGAVPTNTTARNVLRAQDENNWHNLPAIQWLAALAALLHDLGKACLAFQNKLKPGAVKEKNLYRHEWISVRLFQAFVGDDDDEGWLQRLTGNKALEDGPWLDQWMGEARLVRDGLDPAAKDNKPLAQLPPLARAVAWLVLTHHRLPLRPHDDNGYLRFMRAQDTEFRSSMLNNLVEQVDANWNEPCNSSDPKKIAPYWTFSDGLPVTTRAWRKQSSRFSKKLLPFTEKGQCNTWLKDPYIMHLARLCLMLADHHYSSLTKEEDRKRYLNAGYPLYANTAQNRAGRRTYNQTLDEHLLGVEGHANIVARSLPGFDTQLAHLGRHKKLKQRSSDSRFRWQDKASDLAAGLRERSQNQGAFVVNMASTGCGKTLGNARIMNALADPQKGMRCAFAMGLRTLTLQTGRNFRDLLGLGEDRLAIKVGGAANRELFEYYEQLAEASGSASRQDLLEEDSHVLFEGNDRHPLLERLTKDQQVRSLLAAPLLVCTIDHLTPATEGVRGGRQIAPMLRLMSSDLVLDEPDDFDLDDLPALTRLVHWAGLLGSRVLLSSATLPPAIVSGLFQAYAKGRAHFQANRAEQPGEVLPVTCLWVDEFDRSHRDCATAADFDTAHSAFARKRHQTLGREAIRRRSEILPLTFTTQNKAERRRQFALKVRDAALDLHRNHHDSDPKTGKRVSFGLVRMANIDPLYDVALALYQHGAPEGCHIHLCVYHSQFPLLTRSAIEYRLDTTLNRRKPDAVFTLPEIRQALENNEEQDHVFIVLGSPVTEVGRDHDYDWAVVEPSSMRSFIQLAGRIRRHRIGSVDTPNLVLLDTNLRYFEKPNEPAFCKPGFEKNEEAFHLKTHYLRELLEKDQREVIDARPRMVPRDNLRPQHNLVDLEHESLNQTMLPVIVQKAPRRRRHGTTATSEMKMNAASFWSLDQVWLTGVLQKKQPFRHDPHPGPELVLLPDEDETGYCLHRVEQGKRKGQRHYKEVEESLNHRVPDSAVQGERIAPWGQVDFMAALEEQADALGLPLQKCAERFATVTVAEATQGWRFHPVLGFSKKN